MKDVIGYDVQTKTKEIVTSEHAVLDAGYGSANLIQQVQIQYGHRVETKYEGGSSTVYYVNGQPMGQMTVARMVGKNGLLDYNVVGDGGTVDVRTFHLNIQENERLSIIGTKNLTLQGVMFQNTGIAYGVGGLEMAENSNFIFTVMVRSGGGEAFRRLLRLVSNSAKAATDAAAETTRNAVGRAVSVIP